MADGNLPHVLVIMSDQQRADCAGYAGHPLLRTPVMDRLAGEGVAFTHATTPAPLCMPARASFVTGTYPHNHGTWANRGLLRRDLPTLFNCFRDAGYDTALIGKAHLFAHGDADMRSFEPVMRGYGIAQSVQVNGPRGTYKNDNNELTADWKRKGLYARYRADYEDRLRDARVVRASALPVDEHLDSWVGRRAVDLIDGHAGSQPLFLFVGFPGPHEPWDAPGEYATMYAPDETPPPLPKPDTSLLPEHARELMDHLERGKRIDEMTAEHVRAIRANYYGKISLVDRWCGEILDAYRRRGLLDDLLVVFCSDHGEMLGDHGRLFKNTFHEAGLRVPLVFRWPGRIIAGEQSDTPDRADRRDADAARPGGSAGSVELPGTECPAGAGGTRAPPPLGGAERGSLGRDPHHDGAHGAVQVRGRRGWTPLHALRPGTGPGRAGQSGGNRGRVRVGRRHARPVAATPAARAVRIAQRPPAGVGGIGRASSSARYGSDLRCRRLC